MADTLEGTERSLGGCVGISPALAVEGAPSIMALAPCHMAAGSGPTRLADDLVGVIDTAIALTEADFGNIQLLDADGRLRIVAQRNFPEWWVAYWNSAANEHGICGAALAAGERVVVEDVGQSPAITDAAAIDSFHKLAIRAIQSTPLRSRAGRVVGMLSTHFRTPCLPDGKKLKVLDLLAAHAASLVERESAEQALIEYEAQYRAIIESSADGFWILDGQGWILAVNDAYVKRSGYSRDELLRMHISDVEAMEDPGATRQHQEKVRSQGSDLFETAHRAKSGEIWPVEINANFRPDAGGKFYVFCRDITARKATENALRQSESRLHRAQSAARVGTWEWDLQTDCNYWSDEIYQLYGLESRTVDASFDAWLASVHPEDRDAAITKVRDAATRGVTFELAWRTANPAGELRWLFSRGKPEFDADGHPVRYLGLVMDVTEQKQASQALEDARNLLAEAQKIAHLGSFEFDVARGTTTWSEEEYRIYGLDPAGPSPSFEELLERHIYPDDVPLLQESMRSMLEEHGIYELEHRLVWPDGGVRWVHNLAHPYFDEQGRLVRYVGTTLDVTERKRLEEEAQIHNQLMQSLARHQVAVQTAAAFAHELNQPLVAITAYNEVALKALRGGKFNGSRFEHALEGSHAQALRAGQVLRELIDHLHHGEVETTPFDLNALIAETVHGLRQTEYREFSARLDLEPALPRVRGDRLKTEKVLVNLIQNGLEAMAAAKMASGQFHIQVRTRARDGQAQVTVTDSGPGLDGEQARRVFDAFFTTKPNGLGLGLAISRSLIEAQGGELWFDPQVVPGAAFHFTLPLDHE